MKAIPAYDVMETEKRSKIQNICTVNSQGFNTEARVTAVSC